MKAGSSNSWKYWIGCAIAFIAWKAFFALNTGSPATPTAAPTAPSHQTTQEPPAAGSLSGYSSGDSPVLARAGASEPDYARCLLAKMPGAANETVTSAVVQTCLQDHPNGFKVVERGSGRGWLGYDSHQACVIGKAKETPSQRAAMLISAACRCLYEPPSEPGGKCATP